LNNDSSPTCCSESVLKTNKTGSPFGSGLTSTFSFLSAKVASSPPLSSGDGKYFATKSRKLFIPTAAVAETAKTGVKLLPIIAALIPFAISSSLKEPSSKYLFIKSSLVSAIFSIR